MHAPLVDAFRGPAWVSDLLRATGHPTPYTLGLKLDRRSVWKDAAKSGHQSKWYQFNAGLRIPQRRLVRKASRAAPAATFDVLHPAWQFLSNPALSPRSDRRIRAAMAPAWRDSFSRVLAMEVERLWIGPRLLDLVGLRRMSFLDALLLFAQAHKVESLAGRDSGKTLALEAILLALPVLYADDDIWAIQPYGQSGDVRGSIGQLLNLIDRCLSLNTPLPGHPRFPVAERTYGIQWLRWQMDLWRHLHPRALKTRSAQLGFSAWHFDSQASEAVRFALSPFEPATAGPIDLHTRVGRPVDERAWSWAWHNFRLGTYLRWPTERLVEDHWQQLQTRSA